MITRPAPGSGMINLGGSLEVVVPTRPRSDELVSHAMTDECDEFPSHRELYDFLLKTAQVLASKGRADLANEVEHASKFAWGTSTTEYLDAAQKALMKAKAGAVFGEAESAEMSKIIRQIEIEFLKIGGA